MRASGFVVTLVLAMLTMAFPGCMAAGPSVAPFYMMKNVEKEPKFVGVWEAYDQTGKAGDGKVPAVFTISDSVQFGYDVEAEMTEADPSGFRIPGMFVTVFRAGEHRYVNVTLGLKEMEQLSKSVGPFVTLTNIALRAEFEADEVRLYGRNTVNQIFDAAVGDKQAHDTFSFPTVDLLEAHYDGMSEKQKAMMQRLDNPGSKIVVASSSELQAGLVKAEAAGYFRDILVTLRRVKPDKAAPVSEPEAAPVAP